MVLGNMLAANWIKVLGAFFSHGLGELIKLIFVPIYLIFEGISCIIAFAESAFKKIAGIDTIYLNGQALEGASGGTGQDLVYGFITDSAVQGVFWSIVALSIVLLFIFTIVALIKSEFTLDLKGSAKGPIISRSLKSLVNFLVVPAVALVSVIGTNFLTKTIYDMFGGENSTLASKCFQLGAYNANRVRRKGGEDFAAYLTSTDMGNTDFSGGANEVAAEIDRRFVNFEDCHITYKKYDVSDRLDREDDDKYADWHMYFMSYPETSDNFSLWEIEQVYYYYDLMYFDYILGLGSAIVMAWTFFTVMLVLLKRVFELTILFLLAPPMTAIAPLDGGQAEKKWRNEFMKRLLSVIGPIFAYNMYFLLLPLFENISLFAGVKMSADVGLAGGIAMLGSYQTSISEFTFIFNIFFQIVCILTGLSIVKSASALLSNLLGIEDLIKSGGEAGKKAVDLGKKAMMGATAMGAPVLKGAAALAKGGFNKVKSGLAKRKAGKEGLSASDQDKETAKNRVEKSQEALDSTTSDLANNQLELDDVNSKISKNAEYKNAVNSINSRSDLNDAQKAAEIKKARLSAADKMFTKEKDENGNAISGSQYLSNLDSTNTKLKKKKEAQQGDLEKNQKTYSMMESGYSKSAQKELDDLNSETTIDKKTGKKRYKTKEELESSAKRAAEIEKTISDSQRGFKDSFSDEFGENQKTTSVMASFLNSKAGKKVFSGFGSKTVEGILAPLKDSLGGIFAADTAQGGYMRRFNDSLAGLFGENGGGDLWKMRFNKNARASLYENVPEAKTRSAQIEQNLSWGARDKWQKGEDAKKARAAEEAVIKRMLATQMGLGQYSNLVQQMEKPGTSPAQINKLEAQVKEIEIKSGLNKLAANFYDNIGSGGRAEQLAKYKEQMQNDADIKGFKAEQAAREKMATIAASQGEKTEVKTSDQSNDQLAKAIASALATGKGIKLNIGDKGIKINSAEFKDLTAGFGELKTVIAGLAQAIQNLNGGDGNKGNNKSK